jgi:quinol monooxygenase YgiN
MKPTTALLLLTLSASHLFGEALGSPNCENPLVGAETDRELMERTLEVLHRRNVLGVTSGPLVARWQEAGGHRIIPSLGVGFRPGEPSAAEVREGLGSGGFRVFGEVTTQYDGVSPSAPRFEPYLAAAEELDVPVGIHMGTGPPGAPLLPGMGAYHARLHSALELEEALLRHPCTNAARFLRLSEEEVARHHGRAAPPGPEFEVTPTAAGERRRASQRAGGIPDHGTWAGVEVETTNRRSSMVMTVLEARVASGRWEALRASYAERARLSEEVPIVESFLVQADDDPDVWRIVTVWRDRESLEAMRASGETPTGVLIFRDAGAEPRLSVFTVFANPRSPAGSRP